MSHNVAQENEYGKHLFNKSDYKASQSISNVVDIIFATVYLPTGQTLFSNTILRKVLYT